MQRREFIALLGGVAAAWPVGAQAQQAGKQYRIGMLETTGEAVKPADIGAFRKGLRDLGYVEGRNVIIEYRSADGRPERFPALAAELVGLNVDLIVTRGTPAAVAAKNATKTIPVQSRRCFRRVLLPRSLQKARGPETGLWASEPIGKGQPPEIRREFIRAFSEPFPRSIKLTPPW